MLVDEVEDNPEITQLDLSHLHAKHITSRIYDSVNLKRLMLNHNELNHINTDIQYLTKYFLAFSHFYIYHYSVILYRLEHLDLSHNKIFEIPIEIEDCSELKILNLEANHISTFPGNFFKLSKIFWYILFN